MEELDKLFKIYGNDFIRILGQELRKAGKDSSNKLINSLDARLRDIGNNINVEIWSENYLDNVDEGRKKGSYVPIKALESWCSLNGIPKSAAYPISKNIYRFGIKPTYVIKKAQDKWEQENYKKMENEIGVMIEQSILNNIKNIK